MKINQITNQQNFEGKVIVKNKISSQQKALFNQHKPNLDKMIKEMPFDLYVEQSKSKKTITISTNVKGADTYMVRKNDQNYEQVARFAISDAQNKSKDYKKLVKANEILDAVKLKLINIAEGNFKEARKSEEKLAKLAIKDFKLYKEVTNFKIINMPLEMGGPLLLNSTKYKIYKFFTPKTKEEKILKQMNKEYMKEMKAHQGEAGYEQPKPQVIDFNDCFRVASSLI